MVSFLGLDLTKNISYYTVPAALVACVLPHVLAIAGSKGVFDNANPRSLQENLEKTETQAKLRVARAKAASDNGFETIGLYAAGVVAANVAGVETALLNRLTLGYVLSRFAFVFVYVQLGGNRKTAPVRSLTWFAGIATIVALFIKAGNKVAL
ncbi:Membrane associated eicosanoid/glutathione metabolism-like domain protein [Cordyceps fumosorosea ARSEF 2679]|uniref:Membrane associated eicosanoid/glutathione metabolism-like domain protein n=1 Tax=Cordyceps fumosorosea (strain ARSEF 2679) TaxID=1081104 RepID=A0A167ZGT3_CORFA|nr:Membrane associated eicosanoid/glutathione metabolism-like domain protein [Cordyceps fumosorosea ARSEF 2679]OAA67498.1 Membrane associated eicosanoid/glutathione metabolism-like domain protein [Cordyceps fumosorosea ARSEF 2679]